MHLGLDIGTSGVKGLLMTEDFGVVASCGAELTVSRPKTGWAEQDPDDWIAAVRSVIDGLRASFPEAFSALRSIGLSGQMHGAVLLDENDRVLRPCILWNDSRSHSECAELEVRAPFRETGGNIVMPGFTAPKVRWVEKHEPEVFRRIRKVLLPKDYVRLWLTGEHVAEMSDAAGTLWLDVAHRRWSPELLSATNLTEAQMPRLVEGTEKSGALRAELAGEWGIARVPVAGGGGDNAATACGMGVVRPGTGFVSLGTSGVLFAACDCYSPNTEQALHTFCHAVPGLWHHMGVILAAVDSLAWLGRVTGHSAPDLTAMLPDRISRPAASVFLPYLSGERTPHNLPWPAGTFANLSMSTELPDMVQAVLEGVSYAFLDCKAALEAAGTRLDRAFVVGGGARCSQWREILSSVCGIELLVPKSGDFGAAYGAAKLGVACLADGALEDIITVPEVDLVIRPDPMLQDAYAERFAEFSGLSGRVRTNTSEFRPASKSGLDQKSGRAQAT
ncbi:xylulokinase [Rhodobacterales bacterium]|nr:xylulokinase [Rhodobacterales bacterium]